MGGRTQEGGGSSGSTAAFQAFMYKAVRPSMFHSFILFAAATAALHSGSRSRKEAAIYSDEGRRPLLLLCRAFYCYNTDSVARKKKKRL